MKQGIRVISLLCLIATVAAPVWAETSASAGQGTDRVDELMLRYNLHPAFEKLGRGVSNTLGGWLEIPLNLQQRYTPNDTGASIATGLVYGLFKGLVRTGVGLYETVTFFLPYPEDYAPILPTLDYFKHDPKRRPLPLE